VEDYNKKISDLPTLNKIIVKCYDLLSIQNKKKLDAMAHFLITNNKMRRLFNSRANYQLDDETLDHTEDIQTYMKYGHGMTLDDAEFMIEDDTIFQLLYKNISNNFSKKDYETFKIEIFYIPINKILNK